MSRAHFRRRRADQASSLRHRSGPLPRWGRRRGAATASANRRGAATVELAICFPLIATLLLGSLECSHMIYVSQTLHIASYEGARLAVTKQDATNADVIDRASQVLELRNINSASVTLDPPDLSTVVRGQKVTVSLTAPCNANSILTPLFFGGRTLLGETTLIMEQGQ